MKAGDRIRLIKKLTPMMARLSWSELDLTLRQFGLGWTDDWAGSKEDYVINFLEDGSDGQLEELGDYFFGEEGVGQHEPGSEAKCWREGRFRLFFTHVSAKKKFVHKIKEELAKYGIDAFVAHSDIEPTTEWVEEIELALSTCDALVAFLSKGFKESDWTDQEVGHAVARRVLVIPVRLEVTPYGFIARYQALDGKGKSADVLALDLLNILTENNLTREQMTDALITNFVDSTSFVDAQTNWKTLKRVKIWTPERLRRLEHSIDENTNIAGGYYLPEKIRDLIAAHAGS